MYFPPAERPLWTALFGGIHIRRGRCLLILIGKVYQNLRKGNNKK